MKILVVIVADSNALMSVFRLSMNLNSALDRVFGAWEIVVPQPVILELKRLAETNRHARGALSLTVGIQVVAEEGEADGAVLRVSERLGGIVFTNDREVLKAARDRSIPRLYIRGKSVLKAEGL